MGHYFETNGLYIIFHNVMSFAADTDTIDLFWLILYFIWAFNFIIVELKTNRKNVESVDEQLYWVNGLKPSPAKLPLSPPLFPPKNLNPYLRFFGGGGLGGGGGRD